MVGRLQGVHSFFKSIIFIFSIMIQKIRAFIPTIKHTKREILKQTPAKRRTT